MIDAIYEAAESDFDIITPIIKSCNLIEQVLRVLLDFMIKNPINHEQVKKLVLKHLQAFFTIVQFQPKDLIRGDWYAILNTAVKIAYFGDNLTLKT